MNKTFKNPFVTSILTIISAFLLVFIITNLFQYKNISLGSMLIILPFLFAGVYGYYTGEQLPKKYRIKYAIYLSYLYVVTSFIFIYIEVGLSKFISLLPALSLVLIAPVIVESFIFYFAGGAISNFLANYRKNRNK